MEPKRQSGLIRLMQCPVCERTLRETRELVRCACGAELLKTGLRIHVLSPTEAESLRIDALLFGLEP